MNRFENGRSGVHRARSVETAFASASHGTPMTRAKPGQPLSATWDPHTEPLAPDVTAGNPVSRFISIYGWRAYSIPLLCILTVILLVMSVRGSTDGSAFGRASPEGRRNVSIVKESVSIGAPTQRIPESELTLGALPPYGHFTRDGRKTFHVVPIRGAPNKIGSGPQEFTYTVEVEDGLISNDFSGDNAFASMVDATLANRRGWIGSGKFAFRRVGVGKAPDLRLTLTSTNTTRELCGYQIKLETSCFYPPTHQVLLNEARWVRGAISFAGDIHSYRQYQINHEVGHGIGYAEHEPCKQNGALAPVMMQQSFGTANEDIMALDPQMSADRALSCRPNPWPFP